MKQFQSIMVGVTLTLSGSVAYLLMSVQIKQLGMQFSPFFILLLQSFAGLICSILLLWYCGYNLRKVLTYTQTFYFWRSIVSFISVLTFTFALLHIKIFNALLVLNTAPLALPFLRWIFLKKVLDVQLLIFILLGFCGLIIILSPNRDIFDSYTLLAVFSMIAMALSLLILEKQPAYDAKLMIFSYFFYSSFAMLTIISRDTLPALSHLDYARGFYIGALFFIVQASIILAAKYISSQLIALLFYAEILMAMGYSLRYEQLKPTMSLLLGTLMVIVAGIQAIYFEQKQKISESQDAKTI